MPGPPPTHQSPHRVDGGEEEAYGRAFQPLAIAAPSQEQCGHLKRLGDGEAVAYRSAFALIHRWWLNEEHYLRLSVNYFVFDIGSAVGFMDCSQGSGKDGDIRRYLLVVATAAKAYGFLDIEFGTDMSIIP
ncbi:MORC family CW-type zinc finger protein 2 [Striga asiatica]|uniref:MORC family CW-type zinc finger protein 2 n=1 Tax=Striga asiatica TaxID=4170 RepID=A0A5A7Q9T3_STRAF|nr:MORC family CW-type zinc finger protein 2 [Striga asiatica]